MQKAMHVHDYIIIIFKTCSGVHHSNRPIRRFPIASQSRSTCDYYRPGPAPRGQRGNRCFHCGVMELSGEATGGGLGGGGV
jgi:hypothetical protein